MNDTNDISAVVKIIPEQQSQSVNDHHQKIIVKWHHKIKYSLSLGHINLTPYDSSHSDTFS